MTQSCRSCQGELLSETSPASGHCISDGICRQCLVILQTGNVAGVLDAMDAPVLLMQREPRQVVTANKKALELFAKELGDVAGKRGGQVFDCIHSFTEAGCGKDIHCEDCKIKGAIVETFVAGAPFDGVSTKLDIKKPDGITPYAMQVSTESVGALALVRIDRYEKVR